VWQPYKIRDSTLGYALGLCKKLQTCDVYVIEDPTEKVHVYRLERLAHAHLVNRGHNKDIRLWLGSNS